MTAVRRALAAAVALVALAGCTSETSTAGEGGGPAFSAPVVGAPDIDVDTPELREAKAAAGVRPCVPGPATPGEDGLPDVELPCFGGGEPVNLGSLEGPMVINLWASWCGPCRDEMPVFAEFDETYGDQVAVLGIAFNETTPSAGMNLVAETGVTYPLLADVEPELTRFPDFTVVRRGLPLTVVVDADGRVAERHLGEVDSIDELVDLVEGATGPLA